jgi:hypothetical protein
MSSTTETPDRTVVGIWLPKDEAERLRARAVADDRSVSGYLRHLLRSHLNDDRQPGEAGGVKTSPEQGATHAGT